MRQVDDVGKSSAVGKITCVCKFREDDDKSVGKVRCFLVGCVYMCYIQQFARLLVVF